MVLMTLVVSCTGRQPEEILKQKLDSVIAVEFRANEPGGSFMVLKEGRTIWSASYGLTDLNTGEKFTSASVANIGSISKTFVAYGILMLERQGLLSLNDSIARFFPDFVNPDIAGRVRVVHLITHTSGLPDSRKINDNPEFYLTAGDAENFAPLKTTDTLEFEPGTGWKYSNPAYNGLALIIEQVTGIKWQTYITENILKPSGMVNSTITDGAWPDSGVAHGYSRNTGVYEEDDYGEFPTFTASGNGGVWSSADELAKYVTALENCTFTDCETINRSMEVWNFSRWAGPEPSSQGLSWVITGGNDSGSSRCIEHTGSQGGFRAHLMMYPDEKITVIWITNNGKTYTPQIRKVLKEMKFIF